MSFLSRWRRARKAGKSFQHMMQAEANAVKDGQDAFNKQAKQLKESYPLLRRNIHRLEKGLCMPSRKNLFAVDFILPTVKLYANLSKSNTPDQAELRWSKDVLSRYFSVVDHSEKAVSDAYAIFQNVAHNLPDIDHTYEPYKTGDLEQVSGATEVSLPTFESFLTLCKKRRSQRWFLDKPVDIKHIEDATAAALQAPSACNRQPFTFHVSTNSQQIAQIAALPLGTSGFGSDLPALVAVVGDLSMYAEPRDRHLIFIDASLAAMQFMLGISAQNLGSVPINWPDIPDNHAKLREILRLKPHEVPIILIGVGHPDPQSRIPYSAKRSVDKVLHVHA